MTKPKIQWQNSSNGHKEPDEVEKEYERLIESKEQLRNLMGVGACCSMPLIFVGVIVFLIIYFFNR